MKIIDVVQGTDLWLGVRAGIPTASELHRLITPAKLEVCEGKGWLTYVAEKLAERWRGAPLQAFFGSPEMEQGELNEATARDLYAVKIGTEIKTPGFLTTDDGRFGCSPDGLLPDGVTGCEIKAPQPPAHVKWLLGGECPREHWLQCQGGMFVTGAAEWRFVSYCSRFPELITPVERDEEVMEKIAEAIGKFSERIEADYARLVELNGGPPKRRVAPVREIDPFTVEPGPPLDLNAGVQR